MHCERPSLLMADHLDGHLDRAGVIELERHLAKCSTCRAEWHSLSALDQLFRSTPSRPAPVRLRAQVMARIDRREQARRAVFGGLVLALGATAVVLLTLVPTALGLLGNLGIGPTLLTGGVETAAQLLILLDALARTLMVMLDQLAVPLIVLGLGSLLAAMALNGLWIVTMRRLRVASRQ